MQKVDCTFHVNSAAWVIRNKHCGMMLISASLDISAGREIRGAWIVPVSYAMSTLQVLHWHSCGGAVTALVTKTLAIVAEGGFPITVVNPLPREAVARSTKEYFCQPSSHYTDTWVRLTKSAGGLTFPHSLSDVSGLTSVVSGGQGSSLKG